MGVQGQGSTGVQLSLVSATMPRDLQKNIGSLISVRQPYHRLFKLIQCWHFECATFYQNDRRQQIQLIIKLFVSSALHKFMYFTLISHNWIRNMIDIFLSVQIIFAYSEFPVSHYERTHCTLLDGEHYKDNLQVPTFSLASHHSDVYPSQEIEQTR